MPCGWTQAQQVEEHAAAAGHTARPHHHHDAHDALGAVVAMFPCVLKTKLCAEKNLFETTVSTAGRAGGKLNREQRQECESESVADVVVLGGGNTCLARRSSQRATVAM